MTDELVSGDVRLLLDALGLDSLVSLHAALEVAADPSATTIPRRAAKRLLAEYDRRIEAEFGESDPDAEERLETLRRALLDDSAIIVRSTETVEQKGRRYLAEGRVTIQRLEPTGLVVASCRGTGGAVYRLGYDPARSEWRCTCPSPGRRARCSHVAALRIVLAR